MLTGDHVLIYRVNRKPGVIGLKKGERFTKTFAVTV